MDISYYKEKYEPINGKWHIKELLGEGSYGKVFRIEHTDILGKTTQAALKIITIPRSETEIANVRESFQDENSVNKYFTNMALKIADEFDVMAQLKGNTNIVSYEEHDIFPHGNGIGYDILIRMELLTPLNKLAGNLSEQEVIKLAIDICKALEVCNKHNIVHRDIKPENIFLSPFGDYKLGDFGVARTMQHEMTVMTVTGTYAYMAPELKKGEECGINVDVYSLGMVMYKLLNCGREPFLPLPPEMFTFEQREQALINRMRGMPLPPPVNAGEKLAKIILKACEYNPKERYESPVRMREDLQKILGTESKPKATYSSKDNAECEVPTNVESNDKTIGLFTPKANIDPAEEKDKHDDSLNKPLDSKEDNSKTIGLFAQSGAAPQKAEVNKQPKNVANPPEQKPVVQNQPVSSNISTPTIGKASWKIPVLIITAIIIAGLLILAGRYFVSKNHSSDVVELVTNYQAEICIVSQSGDEIINRDQIISIEPVKNNKTEYSLVFELSARGAGAFNRAIQALPGQPLIVNINGETVGTIPASNVPDTKKIELSVDSADNFNKLVKQLGIDGSKIVNATAVAKDFADANSAVEQIKENKSFYQQRKYDVDALALKLIKHQDDIQRGAIDELSDYDAYVHDMCPAWSKLEYVIVGVSWESVAYPAETTPREEQTSTPTPTPSSSSQPSVSTRTDDIDVQIEQYHPTPSPTPTAMPTAMPAPATSGKYQSYDGI